MAEIAVTIETLTPIHLGSGKADVTIDAEIIHDALSFPYFPAKRFKGLLYDNDAGQVFSVQLIVHDFYIKGYEKLRVDWSYLQKNFPELFELTDILNAYTSIRYQTKLEEGSLHNMRVLNAGAEKYFRRRYETKSRVRANQLPFRRFAER